MTYLGTPFRRNPSCEDLCGSCGKENSRLNNCAACDKFLGNPGLETWANEPRKLEVSPYNGLELLRVHVQDCPLLHKNKVQHKIMFHFSVFRNFRF